MSRADAHRGTVTCALTLFCSSCGDHERTAGDSAGATGGSQGTSAEGGGSVEGGAEASGGDPTGGDSTASSSAESGSGGGPSSSTASESGSGVEGGSGGIRLDVGSGEGGPGGASEGGGGANCECGSLDFSYVWIANSAQATVSKINTRTLVEEGRYNTGGTSPSRTSVSVDGKAVAVANRGVGIIKIWARPDFCDPNKNGMPGLQTSTGRTDVLPFGQDDCVEWFQSMQSAVPGTSMTVQRPVQWTSGTYNESTCTYEDQKVWTTTGAGGSGTFCGPQGLWVHRLDGDTGAIENTIHLTEAEFPCDTSGFGVGLGAYGGAVDSNNNFFFHGYDNDDLVRVDFATMAYEVRQDVGPGYGITVDTKGRVWQSASISRYDWATADRQTQNVSGTGGITQDLQDRIWVSDLGGVVWVDMETLAVGDRVPLPGAGEVKGVSVDFDGYIWAIRLDDPNAYKIHPDTYAIETYTGLDGPYTYSDMTGGTLVNITCNPPVG